MKPSIHFPPSGVIAVTPSVVGDGLAAAARSKEIS
jgi:hypothetical protein